MSHTYSDDNPPGHGRPKRIYQAIREMDLHVLEMRYSQEHGRGAWYCILTDGIKRIDCICGWSRQSGLRMRLFP